MFHLSTSIRLHLKCVKISMKIVIVTLWTLVIRQFLQHMILIPVRIPFTIGQFLVDHWVLIILLKMELTKTQNFQSSDFATTVYMKYLLQLMVFPVRVPIMRFSHLLTLEHQLLKIAIYYKKYALVMKLSRWFIYPMFPQQHILTP